MRARPFAAALVIPALLLVGQVPSRLSDPAVAETARIRAHLARVERELRAREVTALTPTQRAARARSLDVLHTYWVGGVFPKNTDFPGERMPYFIDRYGTRCAMAYLIEQSGHAEYVARVAGARNNATVAELAADAELAPPLAAWLEENGLTVAEAARIQPMYCGTDSAVGCIPSHTPGTSQPSFSYKIGTGAALASGLSMFALNASLLDGRLSRRTSGWLGIGAGTLGLALGLPALGNDGGYRSLAPLNTAVGALSVVLGVHALSTASAEPGKRDGSPVVRAGPLVTPQGEAGLAVRLTF